MTRVYLRLLGVALALFVAGLVAAELVGAWVYTPEEADWYATYLRGGYQLAEDALAAGASEADLSARLGVPMRVEEEAPPVVLEHFAELGEGVAWSEDLLTTWTPMRDGRYLVVGPHPQYPGPHLPSRLGVLLGVALAIAGAFWLTLRPLDRSQRALIATAERIAEGDLDARIPADEAGAAPAMASSFNAMADRVEDLLRRQKELLRAVSHELRTPISRLRIGVHLLAEADGGRAAKAEELDDDLEELDQLVEELLTHARLEAGALAKEPQEVSLGPVLSDVVHRVGALHGGVALSHTGDASVLAVPHLLNRALRNLVSNAARHGRRVELSVEAGERVRIHVDDDGPGIPAALRERALLPFDRLDADDGEGHGMGLPIVLRIAQWHGGDLTLGDSPLGGLRATLAWPAG